MRNRNSGRWLRLIRHARLWPYSGQAIRQAIEGAPRTPHTSHRKAKGCRNPSVARTTEAYNKVPAQLYSHVRVVVPPTYLLGSREQDG
jgi:hypothetical protein